MIILCFIIIIISSIIVMVVLSGRRGRDGWAIYLLPSRATRACLGADAWIGLCRVTEPSLFEFCQLLGHTHRDLGIIHEPSWSGTVHCATETRPSASNTQQQQHQLHIKISERKTGFCGRRGGHGTDTEWAPTNKAKLFISRWPRWR